MLLLARTTPRGKVAKKAEGLSTFIVDIRAALSKGLTIRPIRTMMNHNSCELFFDNMEVSAENDAAEILARCLATACNVLNPQAIILAGSLPPAGDLVMNPLREFLGRHVLIPLDHSDMGPTTTLLTASLGPDASAPGAMGLALRQIGDVYSG